MQSIWLWKRLKNFSKSTDFSLWLKSGLLFKYKELLWHYQVETVVKVAVMGLSYDRLISATNCDQTRVKLTSGVTFITAKIMTRQW
jgi:hypothetical protein